MRTVKLALLLLILAAFADSSVNTLATINGTGAAVALSSNPNIRANWIQVVTDSKTLNTSNVMFGDYTVTSTRGLPIGPGYGYTTPPCASCVYPLSTSYVYVAVGDVAYVTWGN